MPDVEVLPPGVVYQNGMYWYNGVRYPSLAALPKESPIDGVTVRGSLDPESSSYIFKGCARNKID